MCEFNPLKVKFCCSFFKIGHSRSRKSCPTCWDHSTSESGFLYPKAHQRHALELLGGTECKLACSVDDTRLNNLKTTFVWHQSVILSLLEATRVHFALLVNAGVPFSVGVISQFMVQKGAPVHFCGSLSFYPSKAFFWDFNPLKVRFCCSFFKINHTFRVNRVQPVGIILRVYQVFIPQKSIIVLLWSSWEVPSAK